MAIDKNTKIATYAEIKEKLSNAKAFVVVDYTGVTVEEVTALRTSCREAGVEYRVMLNSTGNDITSLITLKINKSSTKESHYNCNTHKFFNNRLICMQKA